MLIIWGLYQKTYGFPNLSLIRKPTVFRTFPLSENPSLNVIAPNITYEGKGSEEEGLREPKVPV
jgi:hypothetical protein